MNHVARKQQGFTLIELVLAMAFISILLLAIALTIIQISQVYNRGMTLKELNQVARSISDDLTRSVAASESFSLDASDRRYIATEWGGRLCLGRHSYIWNYAKTLQAGGTNVTKYSGTGNDAIRLAKVPDLGANYCSGVAGFQDINPAGAEELLKAGDRTLALHSLTFASGANARDDVTGQQLYNVALRIGTSNLTALTTDTTACRGPSDPDSDLAYCAVQEFQLVLRAGNRVN